jgi:hypothetical protein
LVEQGTAAFAEHETEWLPLMRALAVHVATHDALNDWTADEVLSALWGDVQSGDAPPRWYAYLETMRSRDQSGAPMARAAEQWLRATGEDQPPRERVQQLEMVLLRCRGVANEALRACYGEALIPHDVPPSALLRR